MHTDAENIYCYNGKSHLKEHPAFFSGNNDERDSLSQLFHRLGTSTSQSLRLSGRGIARDAVHVFYMSLDSTKWNLNMRDDLVSEAFEVIDNLHGFNNLIKRTHKIFENYIVYGAEPQLLPKWDRRGKFLPSPYFGTDQLGGFEGLRQKGWTVITVSLIKLVARDCNVGVKILVQGDNQMVSELIDERSNITKLTLLHKLLTKKSSNTVLMGVTWIFQ